jgi:hypothetical protein
MPMDSDQGIEGWYEDPYHAHQHRWFSAGRPTSLVRNGGIESKDAPPDTPPTEPLTRATTDAAPSNGGDLRRVGDATSGSCDPITSWDVAIDAVDAFGLRLKK